MISPSSQTPAFALQPALMNMHRETRAWLSATELWKRELQFFQKILDNHSQTRSQQDFKKEVDHFQHLITWYNGEVVDLLHKKLRKHEKSLATLLQEKKESDAQYFHEHNGLMDEVNTFAQAFSSFKKDLFDFVERGFSPYK
jgi:hypothetical protein